jgi:uncharacterized protein (TIGR04255 family)
MTVTFLNAPLVELVAELRWGPATLQVPVSRAVGGAMGTGLKNEELFMQFGAVAAAKGYGRFERLVPPGFPVQPYQPVYRYRPSAADQPSPLFQLGNGVFTANAVPPYKSWANFAPKVEEGLHLLETAFRNVGGSLPTFDSALVRYIDAFKGDLTSGASAMSFMSEVLGFRVGIPEGVARVATDVRRISPQISLTVPVQPGTMTILLAEGTVGNEEAVVMDTVVHVSRAIGPTPAHALAALVEARAVIHDMFRDVTKAIHPLMKPES